MNKMILLPCILTSGISRGCKDNSGGIKRVFLVNKSLVSTVTEGATPGLIETITMVSASPENKFFEFNPNKMSSNWVENIQSNLQNGTIGYEQVLTLMFAKNEAAKRNQIKLMGQAELVAIVEDYNTKYWYLGEQNGLELSGGSSNSGTALSDMNGWNITLTGNEHEPAKEVSSTLITSALIEFN